MSFDERSGKRKFILMIIFAGFLLVTMIGSFKLVLDISVKNWDSGEPIATYLCEERCVNHGNMSSLATVQVIGNCGWGCECKDYKFFDLCGDMRCFLKCANDDGFRDNHNLDCARSYWDYMHEQGWC